MLATIEDHTENTAAGIFKFIFGFKRHLAPGFPGFDHQNHPIHPGAEGLGIRKKSNRCAVHDDVVKYFTRRFEQCIETLRLKITTFNRAGPGP